MGEWREVRLGDHADIRARIGWKGLSANEYVDSGPFLIAGKHIVSGSVDWNACDHLTEYRYRESPEIALEAGDVIVSKDGTIGRVARIDSLPGPATLNGTMMLVRPKASLHHRYLSHVLNGQSFKRLVDERVSGSSVPHLFQRDLVSLPVRLPPLEEQRRIAEILDTIDATIQSTERVIAKLRWQLCGVRSDLLEPRDDWQHGHVDMLLKVIDSGKSPEVDNRRPGPAEWGVLKVSAVHSDGFRPDEAKVVPPALVRKADEVRHGDVLMTRANTTALVGMCCYVENPPPRLQLSDKTLRLVPNSRVRPMFLALLLQSPNVRSQIERDGTGSSGSMKNISQEEIRSLSVSWPPVHSQDKVLGSLETIVSRIRSDLESLRKLREIRIGLASDLLSGRVRTAAA